MPSPADGGQGLSRSRIIPSLGAGVALAFAASRTGLKNRLHSVREKYGLQGQFQGTSDIFGKRARETLLGAVAQLPSNTAYTAGLLIEQLNRVEQILASIEKRRAELFEPTPEMNLLDSLPGVALILSVVIALEVGDIRRFKGARRLAEATYWMLSKKEPYRERGLKQVSSKGV